MRRALWVLALLLVPAVVLAQFNLPGSVRPTKIPLHAHRDISDGGKLPGVAYLASTNVFSGSTNTFNNRITTNGITLIQPTDGIPPFEYYSTPGGSYPALQISGDGVIECQQELFFWPDGGINQPGVFSYTFMSPATLAEAYYATLPKALNGFSSAISILAWDDAANSANGAQPPAGTMLYGGGAAAPMAPLAIGAANTTLQSTGAAPAWRSAPTISDFTNMAHDHLDADDGGTLSASAIASGTLPEARGGTGITSLGTGVATWLGTPSTANLASAVTGETGTGAVVFGTGPSIDQPTITAPSIGATEWTNATHAHTASNTGGTLTTDAITSGVFNAAQVYAGTFKLTADVGPTTSTTLANVTGASFSVLNGGYYVAKFFVVWQTDNSGNGIQLALTTPSTTILSISAHTVSASGPGTMTGAASLAGHEQTSGNAITVPNTSASAVGINLLCEITAVIVPSADGTLQLQYAAEDGVNNSTIKQGTCGLLTKLP